MYSLFTLVGWLPTPLFCTGLFALLVFLEDVNGLAWFRSFEVSVFLARFVMECGTKMLALQSNVCMCIGVCAAERKEGRNAHF